MSTSTRSKSASQASPATGPETDVKDSEARQTAGDIAVELEVSRQRQIAWTIGGIIGGALLVWKLGTVGVWAGYVLIALGLFRAFQLVMSFVNPPGTIIVSNEKVVLPRGPHRGKPLEVQPSAVTAAYFLRRSVPWNNASPVLVVEVGEKALVFPRDWFASESEQRQIASALLKRISPLKREPDAEASV